MTIRTTALAALLLALSCAGAAAQTFPARPVRYVVGFSTGTATDIVARLVALKLAERWSQQVIVDNRVGAAGTIGAGLVARAEPDGYTWYMGSSTLIVSTFFMPNVPYDVFRDFEPAILIVGLPTVLIVPPQLPVASLRDLIALARSKPGQFNYAHSGRGTSSHVGAEMLNAMAGIELTEVGFKAGNEAFNGVVRADIAVYFPNLAAALPFLKQGRIKALALSSARRSPVMPDLPTMAETLPGFDTSSFYGIMVPARTPKAIVARINAEVNAVIAQLDMRERLLGLGAEVVGGAPDALTRRLRDEQAQVRQVVQRIEAKEGKLKP